jgi:hypothetical protein
VVLQNQCESLPFQCMDTCLVFGRLYFESYFSGNSTGLQSISAPLSYLQTIFIWLLPFLTSHFQPHNLL